VLRLISLAVLLGSVAAAVGQTAPASQTATTNGTIHGTVVAGDPAKPGGLPLPGVSVTATDPAGKTYATTTDTNGAYLLKVPVGAKYELATDLAGFAETSKEITLTGSDQLADFGVQLASRAEAQAASQQAATKAATDRAAAASQTPSLANEAAKAAGQTPATNQTAANRPAGARNRQVIRQGARTATGGRATAGSQTQQLDANDNGLDAGSTAENSVATAGGESSGGADNSGMADISSDSIVTSGSIGQVNGLAGYSQDDIQQRMAAMQAQGGGGGGFGGDNTAIAGMLSGMMQGGPGGPGGGRGGGGGAGGGGGRGGRGGGGGGGFGGPGGGGGFGGFRQFNQNQIHGNVGYTGSNGVLNAQPWSPTGQTHQATENSHNALTVSATGSPYIPGWIKPNLRQSLFLNLAFTHNTTPTVLNAVVPTDLQRAGNFFGLTENVNGKVLPVTLYDPATGNQILNNTLSPSQITSQAKALLSLFPEPNVSDPNSGNNYGAVINNAIHTESGSLRFTRNFGAQVGGGGRRGGVGGGARGGAGARQNQNVPKVLTQNISFSGSYSHTASDSHSAFVLLGGNTDTTGYSFSFGHTLGYGRFRNNLTLTFNRSNSSSTNYFTNGTHNPSIDAGVLLGAAGTPASVVQNNPLNYGFPGLTFSGGLSGLSDRQPSEAIGQTISFSDFMSWRWKQHNLRWGGDLRRVHSDATGGGNVMGNFSFTGYATQNPANGACVVDGTDCPATGYSFADFLLGLPQTTTIQASQSKNYLRQWVYDGYVLDDWRLAANLTLNLGLRYEYFSPLSEKNNHLVNLDHNADFSQIAVVLPGQVGSVTGMQYPDSLIKPDHNLWSPRLAFAYRLPKIKNAVLRGSYGINYTTNQYNSFAHNLAFQQPFAVTQTNTVVTPTIKGTQGCTGASPNVPSKVTLANGFNCSTVAVQNSYAVNPNYRLPWLQLWNLNLQKTLPQGIVLNIGYNGSRGGDQDMLRIPNRTATSLLNPNAEVFTYDDSVAFSRFNSLVVNVNKRLQKGISLGATYTYGHSIDNASALGGGGGGLPAQDDANLQAEEANSSFDVRHKVSGNFLLELPFGPGRAYLNKGGVAAKILDGWGLSGMYTFATGGYQTPVYNLTVAEAATGANGLRPNRDFTQSISGPRTKDQWFNKAAFTAPATGTFGSASRNSIELPGTVSVNATLSRIFQLGDTRSLMFQLQTNNALNIVQYSSIDTTLNHTTYGQVLNAAPMRSVVYTARYRF